MFKATYIQITTFTLVTIHHKAGQEMDIGEDKFLALSSHIFLTDINSGKKM